MQTNLRKTLFVFVAFIFLCTSSAVAAIANTAPAIIPDPAELQTSPGAFSLAPGTQILRFIRRRRRALGRQVSFHVGFKCADKSRAYPR